MRLGMGLRLSDLLKHGAAGYTGTLLDGMVSYWALDEESGTRYDSVGGNDLTDNNTVGFDTGVNGAAASFVAANSESLTAGSETVGKLGELTVSYWYKPSTVAGHAGLVGRSGWSTLSNLSWATRRLGTAIQSLVGSGSGFDLDSSAVTLEAGVWYHVVQWYDSADSKMRLSVNGETPIVSDAHVLSQLAGIIFTIGGYSYCPADGGPSTFETGQFDEVAIWSRVLTEDERAELYNAGSGFFYPFT